MALSDRFRERAREIVARYPSSRSAILILLHAAQDEVGYVTDEVIGEVADVLGITKAEVADVVTFHTMFKEQHPGRYLISLCTNVSCDIRGAGATAEALSDELGPPHETTADQMFSWEPVECLAYCDWAPIAQVNYRDVPYLTPERARRLCDALRSGRSLDEVVAEFRQAAERTPPEAQPGGVPHA